MTNSNLPTSFPTLLPCPLCMSEKVFLQNSYIPNPAGEGWKPCVWCSACGLSTRWFDTDAEAIAAWNTRPQLQSSEAVERVEEFLNDLDGWEQAYPLSAFPEPDLKKAAELLKAGGMTLDAISASNMRHVVSKLAPKARAAITALTSPAVELSKQDKDDG